MYEWTIGGRKIDGSFARCKYTLYHLGGRGAYDIRELQCLAVNSTPNTAIISIVQDQGLVNPFEPCETQTKKGRCKVDMMACIYTAVPANRTPAQSFAGLAGLGSSGCSWHGFGVPIPPCPKKM